MIAADFARDFVKLPRAVARQLMRDKTMLAVYVECLCRARYAGGADIQPGRGVIALAPGQLVVGRGELAASTATSENATRGALERLKSTGLITIQATNRGTIVSVVGYGGTAEDGRAEPPAGAPTNHQQTTNQPPADHQQTTTNKKQKQRRREEETSPASAAAPPAPGGWSPPAGGRAHQIAEERVARGDLARADVAACWASMVEKRKPLTDDIAASWIAKQRPTRGARPLEQLADADYEAKPW
jgi:hypothetical protein